MRWKQVVCSFNPRRAFYDKNKLFKTLDYWSRDILNFNFSEKGLGVVSPPHFVYNY